MDADLGTILLLLMVILVVGACVLGWIFDPAASRTPPP
jgi:hypothetical protein